MLRAGLLKVDGARALRRRQRFAGLCAIRLRPGVVEIRRLGCGRSGAAGASAGGSGRRSADSRSGASGSLARAAARSRSLREVDVNSRLRFGLAGGAASAGGGAAAPLQSRDPRPRAAQRRIGCGSRISPPADCAAVAGAQRRRTAPSEAEAAPRRQRLHPAVAPRLAVRAPPPTGQPSADPSRQPPCPPGSTYCRGRIP